MLFRKTIKWGVMGAGDVLRRWIKGARQIKGMEVAAVSSRSRESAERSACELGIPDALTYEELLDRNDIEVIYIAVPHQAHKELALRALKAGKHVLVEKPATVNALEFAELTAEAKRQNRFLMEAVWTRLFPAAKVLREVIDSGEIGQVRAVYSDFGFRADPQTGSGRLFDPERAGGSLLDAGIYNLHFADMVLQKQPVNITGLASIDTDELHLQVDEQAGCIAQYDRGELAVMASAVRVTMPATAMVYGTEGFIEIPVFWKPEKIVVSGLKGRREIPAPVSQRIKGITDEGYQYEIAHVNECIREGRTESPVMTWEKSLGVLKLCDKLRGDWGLQYPCEQTPASPGS